jgi:hypothetical protein
MAGHWESPASYWPQQRPAEPAHLITHLARLRPVPAACHASPTMFVHRDLHNCTHVCSPLTAAPTRSSRRDRRCNSLYAASLSQCRTRRLSKPTYWKRPTARTQPPLQIHPRVRWPHHRGHFKLSRLQAPTATSAFLHASNAKQTPPRVEVMIWSVRVTLWLTVSQSVDLSVKNRLRLVSRWLSTVWQLRSVLFGCHFWR